MQIEQNGRPQIFPIQSNPTNERSKTEKKKKKKKKKFETDGTLVEINKLRKNRPVRI
jgi:hypothetical protein